MARSTPLGGHDEASRYPRPRSELRFGLAVGVGSKRLGYPVLGRSREPLGVSSDPVARGRRSGRRLSRRQIQGRPAADALRDGGHRRTRHREASGQRCGIRLESGPRQAAEAHRFAQGRARPARGARDQPRGRARRARQAHQVRAVDPASRIDPRQQLVPPALRRPPNDRARRDRSVRERIPDLAGEQQPARGGRLREPDPVRRQAQLHVHDQREPDRLDPDPHHQLRLRRRVHAAGEVLDPARRGGEHRPCGRAHQHVLPRRPARQPQVVARRPDVSRARRDAAGPGLREPGSAVREGLRDRRDPQRAHRVPVRVHAHRSVDDQHADQRRGSQRRVLQQQLLLHRRPPADELHPAGSARSRPPAPRTPTRSSRRPPRSLPCICRAKRSSGPSTFRRTTARPAARPR